MDNNQENNQIQTPFAANDTSQNMTPPAQPNIITNSMPFNNGNGQISNEEISNANGLIAQIKSTYSQLVVGQEELFESIMITLLSRGHLLIEGVPGLAKTTAAHTIASSIGADFARIQCTPDMLPADIVGSQIYNQEKHEFVTQLGPINHSFILVDEINRTGAKTQSALLEAMQERQVSIGGKTHPLPKTFIVMATQNPIEQEGTYQLPEAQLDRFLIKHIIRYPNFQEEVEITKRQITNESISKITPAIHVDELLKLQELSSKIHADDTVINYIVSLVDATRNPENYQLADIKPLIQIGASPRASLSLLACGKAYALMNGSNFVTPDHVKPFLERVLRHRIAITYEAEAENVSTEQIIGKIGSAVKVP